MLVLKFTPLIISDACILLFGVRCVGINGSANFNQLIDLRQAPDFSNSGELRIRR